jgi:hypothetical protein
VGNGRRNSSHHSVSSLIIKDDLMGVVGVIRSVEILNKKKKRERERENLFQSMWIHPLKSPPLEIFLVWGEFPLSIRSFNKFKNEKIMKKEMKDRKKKRKPQSDNTVNRSNSFWSH